MKRKLKKLEQILAENPSYVWNDDSFYFEGAMPEIDFKMIHYFGKEIDTSHEDIRRWHWDKSWFEQPVKKKLYAYKVKMYRPTMLGNLETIIFSENKDESEQRTPEWDIEYGDYK